MCNCLEIDNGGSNGENGLYGGYSSNWNYDNSSLGSGSPIGYLRLNNSNPALTTGLYINTTNAQGALVDDFLDSFKNIISAVNNFGLLRVFSELDSTKYAYYDLTSVLISGAQRVLSVTYIDGSGSFIGGESLVLTFTPRGPKGTTGNTGATGATGPAGPQGDPGENGWLLNGNTNAIEKWIGTVDSYDFPIRTGNTERARLLTTGEFGIGTNTPTERLHVNGGNLLVSGVSAFQTTINGNYSISTGGPVQFTNSVEVNAVNNSKFTFGSGGPGWRLENASSVIVGHRFALHRFEDNNMVEICRLTTATNKPRFSIGTITYDATLVVSGEDNTSNFYNFKCQNSSFTDIFSIRNDKLSTFFGRVDLAKGDPITAANSITLPYNGNTFPVTGNTQINAITTTDWTPGSIVILIFTGTPTVKHNTAGSAGTAKILLNGSVDLVAALNTVLMLVYDGTQWQEISRKVA